MRRLRRVLRRRRWALERRRIEALRPRFDGRRAFLLGSGPSLSAMDLSRLEGEFVCVVNLALRAVGSVIPHADMHVMNDVYGFEAYGEEIESLVRRHRIGLRFLNQRLKPKWRRLPDRGTRPIFVLVEESMARVTGRVPPIEEGVARGATVLISAASLLKAMGFREVFVLGCDLDYGAPEKYVYSMTERDAGHEENPRIKERRRDMIHVNQEFAAMRAAYEEDGRRLLNAGRGGNLVSLERTDFDGLFPSRSG